MSETVNPFNIPTQRDDDAGRGVGAGVIYSYTVCQHCAGTGRQAPTQPGGTYCPACVGQCRVISSWGFLPEQDSPPDSGVENTLAVSV